MNAPVAQRSAYSDLYGSNMLPVLEEVFRAEIEMHPSRREALFKIVPTSRDIWQYSEMHDMPLFSQVNEGSSYSFSRTKQGANLTLTIVKYGLGFSISEEMVDDGKFDEIGDMVRRLGRSALESQEVQAMNIFNNGFDSETSADGQYVFDSDHSLPSGGTFRNIPSAAVDLSQSALDSALADFDTQFVGDSGIYYRCMPQILLVHPNSKRYAKELVGSSLKPDTADNNLNAFLDDGLRVMCSPHLTDTDAWFLIGSPDKTGLRIVSRAPIQTKAAGPDAGFVTDSILYKARYREKIGVTHPYNIWGSAGAA
jgi:phage major head subunit gpT-like protein